MSARATDNAVKLAALRQIDREQWIAVVGERIARVHGNLTQACELLDVDRSTLNRWIEASHELRTIAHRAKEAWRNRKKKPAKATTKRKSSSRNV